MILLKKLLEESFGEKEVAPDYSASALSKYMQETYNMVLIGFSPGELRKGNREYIFRRDDGREFRYTVKDLRSFGAPIELGSKYSRPTDRWRPKYKKTKAHGSGGRPRREQ